VKLDVAEFEKVDNEVESCSSNQMPELAMNAARQAAAADRVSGRR
jgi:hypothetical protein